MILETTTTERCKNHPTVPAVWQCGKCRAALCRRCMGAGITRCDFCGSDCAPTAVASDALRLKDDPIVDDAGSARAPVGMGKSGNSGGTLELRLKIDDPIDVAPPIARVEPLGNDGREVRGWSMHSGEQAFEGGARCSEHAHVAATRRCGECGNFVCPTCIRDAGVGLVCPGCNARLRTLTRSEQGKAPKAFFSELPMAFLYPFTGHGIWVLIFGGILFWLFSFRPLTFLLACGVRYAYMMKIVRHSANGESKAPDLPSWTDWYYDIVQPLFLFVGAMAFCFAPLVLFMIFLLPKMNGPGLNRAPRPTAPDRAFAIEKQRLEALDIPEADRQMQIFEADEIREEANSQVDESFARSSPIPDFLRKGSTAGQLIGLMLILLGAFYLPMALLAVTLFESLTALTPALILPAIARVLPHYCFTFIAFFGVFCLEVIGNTLFATFSIFGGILAVYASLYLGMVQMRILGVLYSANEDKLGWFK